MNICGYYPQTDLEYNAPTDDLVEAMSQYREAYPDAIVTEIDGREVVGFCEGCEMPVFADDPNRRSDDDGIHWHETDCTNRY